MFAPLVDCVSPDVFVLKAAQHQVEMFKIIP